METIYSNTIGNTLAQDYRTASVFQKYGIDFCCKGGKTIDEVWNKKAIDKSTLLSEINKVTSLSWNFF